MGILHIELGYFKVTWHVGIAFRAKFSLKGIQTIQTGYFEATMHVSIAFSVDSSFKLAILAFILTSTNQNFGALLQYLHSYLFLPIKNMGLNYNNCIRAYLYQLGFWGLVTTSTFKTIIIYHYPCVFAFQNFCAYYLEIIITFVAYQTSCVC